jgi:hypothetical protein
MRPHTDGLAQVPDRQILGSLRKALNGAKSQLSFALAERSVIAKGRADGRGLGPQVARGFRLRRSEGIAALDRFQRNR